MQFQKEEIRDKILTAAREEFRKKGFEKASIRNITRAAHTSKSNVYNYFHDKDALFTAVVEPTLTGIRSGFEKLQAENPRTSVETYTVMAQKKVIRRIMEFVYNHEDDLKLLLFSSSGSTQSGFKDTVTEGMADVLSGWISFSAPEKGISELFIKTVAGFYIGAIEQIISQDMLKEQASGHFDVFLKFVFGGWSAVLQQNMD